MAKVTVKHECGHKSRVEVGDGPAQSKSVVAFRASLELCQDCDREEREAIAREDNPPCYLCDGYGCGRCQYTGIL